MLISIVESVTYAQMKSIKDFFDKYPDFDITNSSN